MDELVKKFLYTGVGLAALTAEKLQETVDEMVGKGKVSKDEGKKIVDDFVDKVENQRGDFEKRWQEMVDNFTSSVNFPKLATQDDLAEITRRLDAIEAKVEAGTAAEVQAAVAKNAAAAEKKLPATGETTGTKTAAKKTATRAKKSDSSTAAK
jgi:polyhydroxyalkanoate synthesis regulator phasin